MSRWRVLLLTMVLAVAGAVEGLHVQLRAEVALAATSACLEDLAELSGDPALVVLAAPVQITRLDSTTVRTVTPALVRAALGRAIPPSQVRITGSTRVARLPREVTAALLVAAAASSAAVGPGRPVITVVRSPGNLVVPSDGQVPRLVVHALGGATSGTVAYVVKVVGAEGELARTMVTLHVARLITAVVATRDLTSGTLLKATDLRVVDLALDGEVQGLVDDPAIAIGQEVRHAVRAGSPLVAGRLQPPRVVRAGETITLEHEVGTFVASAPAECLSDGRLGERVRVRRIDGHAVWGAVAGPGRIRLE